jgi:hypothetical protein
MDNDWTATGGVVDIADQLQSTIGTSVPSVNTEFYSVQYKAKTGLFNSSLAYLDVLDPERFTLSSGLDYRFQEYDWTTEIPSGKFLLHYESVKNVASYLPTNAETSGYVARLKYLDTDLQKPGTTAFYAEYLSMGNWATDSTYAVNDYNGCAGDGIGQDGAKGFGIGLSTVIAPNAKFNIWGYKLKPYDPATTGTLFTNYVPSLQTSLTFRF